VLSRCQRFDLRRIPADVLTKHFAGIAAAEKVIVEPEALALIARAAEGSVRDGLSILDQAIAHAGSEEPDTHNNGAVTAAQVRDMLGLSDRGAVRRLFQLLLAADALPVLAALKNQHDLGVEPLAIVRGLMEACHGITLAKVGASADPAQSEEERAAFADMAGKLPFGLLHRLWQLLLKAHDEVSRATDPQEALEMALLRLVYASSLPDPGELAARLEGGQSSAAIPPVVADAQSTPTSSNALPHDFPALIALLEASGKHQTGLMLRDAVGLVEYAPPGLRLFPLRPLPADAMRELATEVKLLTQAMWHVTLSETPGAPSLYQQEAAREATAREAILAHPIAVAAMAAFPEAELLDRTRSA